jgi:phosphatidyl-myo-inositol dimannoside synthase
VRALFVTPDFPPAQGGIQLLTHRLAEHLPTASVRVLALRDEAADIFDRRSAVDTVRVRAPAAPQPARIAALNASALRRGLVWRPNVVLSMHVVVAPGVWALSSALGRPWVQYVHAVELALRPRLAAWALQRATLVVAVSRHTKSLAVELGAEPSRVRVIPPGVDLPGAPTARERERALITVARIEEPYKGHDVIARALPLIRARVPDVRWIVVGDGPLRSRIEMLVAARGLDGNVQFAGAVADERRDELLDRAAVFVLPSRLSPGGGGGEGFGIVYLEAAARGLPVVAGNVGGAVDAVVDGETGVLVPPTDHLALADAVSDLLLNAEKARAMGEAGAARAHGFAWPCIAARLEEALLELNR